MIKKGYFNFEIFLKWLEDRLLSLYNLYLGPNSVIVLNNAGAHVPLEVDVAIRRRDYLVRFLPLYSLNYSPIKLSFSILKVWVRRYFHDI